ncbi:MAG: crossover junction endodeoxyribonuclease RuvC [Candidatus Omnitrophica bacterium]|nr:crossover junction endodeoxyribonuclease RuvC [Candidatus Omnitrophota bacterium]
MKIVGIDPGLERTGFGVVEAEGARYRLIDSDCLTTDERQPLPQRLQTLHDRLCLRLASAQPEAVAVEELYSHYGHPRTAILMGHARGVIYLAAAELGLPLVPYAATHIKRAVVGNGGASKAQVQRMVQQWLQLACPPEPEDLADALAIALAHIFTLQGRARLRPTGGRGTTTHKVMA